MNSFFDNNRIFKTVWNWKFHIIVVVAIAGIAGVFVSSPLVITPMYKSTARIYPQNIKESSKESESEHLLENAQSHDLKFRVIDAFGLDTVYKIKKSEKLYQTYMLYEFNENVSFRKTEFETIEIKVLDKDPNRACAMVDSIIVFINDQIQAQQSQKYLEFAKVSERDLIKKNREIDSLGKIVDSIRSKTGLVDYYAQAEYPTQGLMISAALKGDSKPAKAMTQTLVEAGGILRKHQIMLRAFEVAADTLRSHLDTEMSKATQKLSYAKVVQKPFPADKKSYPVRWLIVFLFVASAGFISVLTVSLIDYIRDQKLA